jgi:apolipoprotein N-acyltransferase
LKLIRAFFQSRYPWAIAAGLLLAISFPKLSIAGMAWIAPGLILLSAAGTRGWQAFRIGYVAGLAHYLASLYWLLLIPVAWFPILGWAALSGFLSLFMGAWVSLCWRLFPVQLATKGWAIKTWSERFLSAAWASRMIWALTGAALWVAWEMTLARFLGGFPWNFLATSQYKIVPLIQIASFTGIYGISFLVVWTSLSFICAGVVILQRPLKRSAWAGEIILPAVAVLALYTAGYRKLLQAPKTVPTLSVAMVQPSIPQSLIWDPAENSHRFEQLLELSRQAMKEKPAVILWPEAALPKMLRYDDEIYQAVTGFARSNKVWMIVGSDDAEPHPKDRSRTDYFNSSFLISPNGILMQRYRKRNLVIFGEYIPLLDWLPFLKYFTPIDGGFTPGDRAVPFEMKDLGVNVSVLICFEDAFPQLVREYVSANTDFLINLTNDGWFGDGAAQWQHAAGAIFRAVENGIPLVRCSNNGLTCWIDDCGRLRQIFESPTQGIYGPGFLVAQVPVLLPGETRPATFYRQYGDVFGWGCAAFVLLQLVRRWLSVR